MDSPLRKESILICKSCHATFKATGTARCNICSIPFRGTFSKGHSCGECVTDRPRFKRAIVPYLYEGQLERAVKSLKYRRSTNLAQVLGRLLAAALDEEVSGSEDKEAGDLDVPTSEKVIIPVPLHKVRLKERGFNQSLLIGRVLGKELNITVDYRTLKRDRHTPPQVKLKRGERRGNVKGAFSLTDTSTIKGKTIYLVDDVLTTGATLRECSKVLCKGGAKEVIAMALARAIHL